ncbi:type I polyketide synthase [Streptomyces sp. 35G-GA-8]|uniref:type I polyketide synthase n=1 Tax=Streptomyces sp. 35G-GA-8 TaxID=2939434 RepID=UPI00201F1428|nr:type I polyketide synthase [Streptomyces sp. 35G-GA-8]MCL7377836.1 SDR family oxidoreductase [Streptomyces sp. 35G-GA-8]
MRMPESVASIESSLPQSVIAVNPLHRSSPRLTAAAARAGALSVLELSTGDPRSVADTLDRTVRWSSLPFGVRIRPGCTVTAADLPEAVDTVLLADPGRAPGEFAGRRVLVEVTDPAGARQAASAGAAGLIVRGAESGGRAGELSTFVLLQRVLADPDLALPVWACGGIGPHTAAAAVAGGATGVVLDTQLALFDEAGLPAELTGALTGLDGSETVLHHGTRVLRRRGPGAPELPADPVEFAARVGSDDPRTQFLPVGQDAFLAASFAGRWKSVGDAIRGVRAAISAAVEDDRPAAALAADSAGAQALGTRFPIAQGPMTRVSDEPEFAAAVAAGGGLPFLALALANADRTRTMLERTREALGDAPCGVGVLGFADEEIRSAQLEVVRELRPTHAIIAGGRPAQAAALEAEGITTFLHVPSPGLLRQFLAAGARRFIFEGAECGGHVGPRNSFPLWEAQTEVLLDFIAENGDETAAELTVLFAGGIHDARSAAMAAALAAPLTRAGAAFGVLMGTAYLFTEEAVAAGAIQPLFQRRIVAAERTDLLETAPGHATRCAHSAITGDFARLKAELRGQGVPDREIWEQLERFNVGRLRLASKGIERVGDELRPVDETRQSDEGMFMAGEVCVLRESVTTVAALHESVADGAAGWLRSRAAELRTVLGLDRVDDAARSAPEPLRIAVVGMAGMFPGAPDLAEFWANILAGKDCVTEVPAHRWDAERYYAPDGDGEHTPSRWGGFLPEIPFDPLRYGIPPASLASIEPVQLLALEAARRALADAGYDGADTDHARTSVVFGAEAGSDLSNATTLRTVLPGYVGTIPSALDEQLPRLTEDSFPGMLANVIAGRIANRLDLGGANYTVDAACASSLTAVDVACKELITGTSDLVLCGGADLHNGINDYLLFSSVHALSPTGRSATFDGAADGIALGEGVACVALKRLADAERDGDRIYAVIDGVGSASDGRALGLTAPRPAGQRSALTRAYRNAGVSPADVGLIEAHGTGTVVGDRTELATLTEVFTEAGAEPAGCAIGSVKSQIGHTKCAAGLAGLIKTTLALYHGVKPPTLHVREPNAAWDGDSSPFVFHTAARPWAAEPADRIAGVSAFGFGGTNFHVVLRAYDQAPAAHTLDTWPAELFTFRGRDAAAARRAARALLELIQRGGAWRLRDYARHAAHRSDQAAVRDEPVRIAVVAPTLTALPGLLRRAADGEHDPEAGLHTCDDTATGSTGTDGEAPGKLAFLFPGQGSQRPGMLAELFVAFPELQRYLQLGARWSDALYPPAAFDEETKAGQLARITDTSVAQPALGVVELAAAELLASLGVRPAMAAGHSYGELVALGVAGALAPQDVLTASAARAEAILAQVADGDAGTMAAVTAGVEQVEDVLRRAGLAGDVVAANHNAPRQTVISGPTEPMAAAVTHLRDAGYSAKPLQVACAFHSPLLAGAGDAFADRLASMTVHPTAFDVWANRTAESYPPDPEAIRAGLAAQIGAPVRFTEQIEAMYAAGARVFAEVGPGRVLSGLVSAVLGDRPHRTVPLDGGRGAGLTGFLTALAQLAVGGADVRTARLFQGRDAVDPESAVPERTAGWTVDGQLVRLADGTIPPNALHPARPVTELIVPENHAHHGAAASGPDALVAEFLRTSRDLVAAQRDVMLSYLGGPAAVPVDRPAVHAAAPQLSAPVALPAAPVPATAVVTTAVVTTAPPAPAVAAPVLDRAAVLGAVLAVVAERTGYPVDMIEPDLDLEADLSVDSIKRTEIAGELAVRLGLPVDGGAELDGLSAARTAAGIAGLLATRLGGGESAETSAPKAGPAESGTSGSPAGPAAEIVPPQRLEFTEAELPAVTGTVDSGSTVLVLGGGELAPVVADRLRAAGAVPRLIPSGELPEGGADAVLCLDALDAAEAPLPEAFPLFQSVLAGAPRRLLAVERRTEGAASGLRGFFRSVAREYPELAATLVEVAPGAAPDAIADALVTELAATEREPVVLTDGGTRRALRLTLTDLGSLAATGAGPAGDGVAEAEAAGLDRDAVVLLVGGARGITARFARTIASVSRCRIELMGRTPVPAGTEDPATAGATDRAGLRAVFLAAGPASPAEIERRVSATLAAREVRDTIAGLRALGSQVRYHCVDVLDGEAVRATVKDIHAEHGRLDGVVYAAGVIEDKLIAEKPVESFRRVFSTKVGGARAVLDAVDSLPTGPRFAVLFGSIAAALGNRGQSDYAAANDALEELGRRWSTADRRGLTVHWGPWAAAETNGGMVTPELMRSYASRGIKLIDPEEGPLSLLRELAWGAPSVHAAVYTASGW